MELKCKWRLFIGLGLSFLIMGCATTQGDVIKNPALNLSGLSVGILEVSGYESQLAEGKIFEKLMQLGSDVIERTKIESILREQKFQASGVLGSGQAVEIGKIIGVKAVFIGNVSQPIVSRVANFADNTWFTSSVSFTGRLIDVESGKTLLSGTITSKRGYPNLAVSSAIESFFEKYSLVN